MNILNFYDSVEDGRIITFKIDERTEQKLIGISNETGLSKSAVIRLLLRQAINLNKKQDKRNLNPVDDDKRETKNL
jgi:hypothetical protein